MRVPITVHVEVAVEIEDVEKLAKKLSDRNIGLHLVNTLLNSTGIDAGQFRGFSFDIDTNRLTVNG